LIAIVPERGGSKGLSGKNIKKLYSKEMIAYTIEAALNSPYISDVIISTDDQEIADVAVKYGAICPFMRPKELASDTALVVDTYTYTIDKLNEEFGYNIEDFVVLQPTSPLRITEDINGAIKLFKEKEADSVITYTEEHHPISWHKYITDEGKFENIFDDKILNRQALKPTYYPNGAVFVFKYELIKQQQYYSANSYAYLMPRSRSTDVDTIEDFEYVEFLMGKQNV